MHHLVPNRSVFQVINLLQLCRDMLAMQLGTAYEEIAVRDAALAESAAYMQVCATWRMFTDHEMNGADLLSLRRLSKGATATCSCSFGR